MVETVNQLSALAKMNFRHEDCWQVYTALIEGGIRHLLDSYFTDWQLIERDITALYMKRRGMFTTRLIVDRIDDKDPDRTLVTDIDKFRKTKRLMFSRKISYLKRKKIISQPMYDLLKNLAKRRNRIHEYAEVLTDDDRELFARGYTLLHPTFTAQCFEEQKDHWKYQIELCDKSALDLLKLIDAQESSKCKGSLFADTDISRVKGGWELDKERAEVLPPR